MGHRIDTRIILLIFVVMATLAGGRSLASDEEQEICEPVVSQGPIYHGAMRPGGPVVGSHSRRPLPPRQLIEVSPTIDRAFILSVLSVMVGNQAMGALSQATLAWPQPPAGVSVELYGRRLR
jgi:hypothetical protein